MGPLDGVRVLEAGLLVQGPQAALTMQEWGADVVKIELPGFGDQSRWLPIARGDRRSAFFTAYNRGKRSMTIDLRVPKGREVFLRLVEDADVVITNFKPGTMEEWGLGYADAAARNQRIIYAMGSSFGPEGPDATREGADLSAQAGGGLISTTGGKGADPSAIGATIADHISGQNLLAGILAALYAARAHGTRAADRDVAPGGPGVGAGRGVHPVSAVGRGLGPKWAQPSHDPGHLRRLPDRRRVDRHRRHRRAGPRPVLPDHRPAGPHRTLSFAPVLRGRQGGAVADPRRGVRHQADGGMVPPSRRRRPAFRPGPGPRRGGGGRRRACQRIHRERHGPRHSRDLDRSGPRRRCASRTSFAASRVRPPELGQHTEEVLLEAGYSWDDIASLSEAGAI